MNRWNELTRALICPRGVRTALQADADREGRLGVGDGHCRGRSRRTRRPAPPDAEARAPRSSKAAPPSRRPAAAAAGDNTGREGGGLRRRRAAAAAAGGGTCRMAGNAAEEAVRVHGNFPARPGDGPRREGPIRRDCAGDIRAARRGREGCGELASLRRACFSSSE